MSVRRQGVISDYGSLEAYRTHVVAGRDACAARLRAAVNAPDQAGPLLWEMADWEVDLEWVDAELARDAA